MKLGFIDWIWHVRGSLALVPGQSSTDAFDRLEPLFDEVGTSHERTRDTLIFTKKNPAAQDKMSVFNHGVLAIQGDAAGPVLRYKLSSRTLLFCFLLPLLYIGVARLTVEVGKLDTPSAADIAKAKAKEATKKKEKDKPEVAMNPIDKFLGAPEPKKKATTPEGKAKEKAEKAERARRPFSPMPALVFAGIFATLYVAGRILEDRLVKRLFRNRLQGAP